MRQSYTTLLLTVQRLAIRGTPVTVRFTEEKGRLSQRIIFQAKSMSDELQRSFFQTFPHDRTCSQVEDLGLAIPLAAEVIRAMGGKVDLQKTASGMEIHLTLIKDSPDTTA